MRRKSLAKRERNGKPQRGQQEMPSAAEVQRLRAASLAGMRDAAWGTTLGWLYLSGKLTSAQFAAGRRWTELAHEYALAVRAPLPPRSASLERSASSVLDPDSAEGRKEARRQQQVCDEFERAGAMLAHAGLLPARAIAHVCEQNLMPVGVDGLSHLATGLQTLVIFWGGGRQK